MDRDGGGVLDLAHRAVQRRALQLHPLEVDVYKRQILNYGLDNVSMLADRWHTIVFPALFIILTMLAFNLLGDGLRDAMDPRMRK